MGYEALLERAFVVAGLSADLTPCPKATKTPSSSHVRGRSGELRNHTADVLRRVEAGEQMTITSRGRPVAELTPVRAVRRRPIARAELTRRLGRAQPDSGLSADLAVLAGDTTDDLASIL